MTFRKPLFAIAAITLFALFAPAAASAASPAWRVSIASHPTNFTPDYNLSEGNLPEYVVHLTNVGSAPSSGPVTVTIELGPEVTEHGTGNQVVNLGLADFNGAPDHVNPADGTDAQIPVDVGSLALGSTVETTVTVSSGGGAATQARTTTTISAPSPVFSAPPPFGFLPDAEGLSGGGLSGSATDPAGSPVSQAGDHPFQVTFDLGFPSKQIGTVNGAGELLGIEGSLRDLITILPKGLIANPAATPVKCTEVQFETGGCPDASAVGAVHVTSVLLGGAGVQGVPSPLYNMVPAAGEAAQLAFEPLGAGIFIHVSGGLRAGDYSLQRDLDRPPVARRRAGLRRQGAAVGGSFRRWARPGRGDCHAEGGATPAEAVCPVPAQDTPFLDMPNECRSEHVLEAEAACWVNPENFHQRSAPCY